MSNACNISVGLSSLSHFLLAFQWMPSICSALLVCQPLLCLPERAPHHFAGELRVRNRRGLLGAGVFAAAGVLAAGVFGGLPGPCMRQHSIAVGASLPCAGPAMSAAGTKCLTAESHADSAVSICATRPLCTPASCAQAM